MNVRFPSLPEELKAGTPRALKTLGLTECECGTPIYVKQGKGLTVEKKNGEITVTYERRANFFRALGHISEHRGDESYLISEKNNFETVGAMPDLSFDCPLTVSGLSKFIDYMAVMGLNTLYLYMEDLYEVPNRKFFGYMRGRYTDAELREIDDYAFDYGIEVIPCIQTLGHMFKYLVWPEAAGVKETAGELDITKPETYEFIEDMLKAGTKNFRSNRVHVGLDEVFNLGRAIASIQKHGYRDQEEMFLTHLEKVIKITDKLGLRPMMWNDFVFCLHSTTGYDKYDEKTVVPKEIMARFPKNVELVYWHYGEEMTGCDDYMLKKNLEFGNPVIFCGGLMMWQLPLPDNMFSYETTEEGILAAKKNGIKDVFTALWTYSKNGCDFFTTLLHLQQYAEHAYRDNPTKEDVKARFEACTGADFDAFMNMSQFSHIMDGRTFSHYSKRYNGQKLMFDDVLEGKYEYLLWDEPMSPHYAKWADYYKALVPTSERWGQLYSRIASIFTYMEKKTYLAENLRKEYQAGNKVFLEKCEKELLPELVSALDDMLEEYRIMWFADRKAFGWSVFDERVGGIRARLVTAKKRLEAYRLGLVPEIEELAAEALKM